MVANNFGSWGNTCSWRSASAQSRRRICCKVTRNWFVSSIIVASPQCQCVFRHVLSERTQGIVVEQWNCPGPASHLRRTCVGPFCVIRGYTQKAATTYQRWRDQEPQYSQSRLALVWH